MVEDDENLNRGITFSLKKSGNEVFSAAVSYTHLKNATLENAVLALASLYIIEIYLMKELFGNMSIIYTLSLIHI